MNEKIYRKLEALVLRLENNSKVYLDRASDIRKENKAFFFNNALDDLWKEMVRQEARGIAMHDAAMAVMELTLKIKNDASTKQF